MENKNQEQGKSKSTMWIVLLILSAVLNIYQWRNHTTAISNFESKVDTLVVEKVNVEQELSETKSELEKYRGISSNLDSLLNEAQAKIDEQAKKIRSLGASEKDMKTLNAKLKQQLADLQVLRDEYLTRIDSLLMANKQLVTEKEELTSTNQNLTKYTETALAKRTHKLSICFDVLDNKIAKTGEKTVYLKITEPGGKPMGNKSTGSASFKTASGEEVMYAASSTLTYTGVKQNVCMNYEEQEDKMFPPGTYMIEVYIDGNLSGAGTCVLR